MNSQLIKSNLITIGILFSLNSVAQVDTLPKNGTMSPQVNQLVTPQKKTNEQKINLLDDETSIKNQIKRTQIQNRNRLFLGGVNGGGGDPAVIEFLDLGENLLDRLIQKRFLSISPEHFDRELKSLRSSLDDSSKKARVIFTDEEIVCREIPKVGCTDDKKKVTINRRWWENAGINQKYELVALEIFQLMGLQNRYSNAKIAAQNMMEGPVDQIKSCYSLSRQLETSKSAFEMCRSVGIECFKDRLMNGWTIYESAKSCRGFVGDACYFESMKLGLSFKNAVELCRGAVQDDCFLEYREAGYSLKRSAEWCRQLP